MPNLTPEMNLGREVCTMYLVWLIVARTGQYRAISKTTTRDLGTKK